MTTLIRRTSRPAGALASGAVLVALLVGCGGTDEPAATDPAGAEADAGGAPSGVPGRAGGGMPGAPGTVGLIAAVDGDVLQVQSQMTGQVAVTVADATTITEQTAATLADVTAGVCVVVRSTDAAGDSGDPSDEAPTEVEAASVAVSPASADGCTGGGLGGPGGGGPAGGERATDLPSDLPADGRGGPAGGRPGGFGTVGEVTSVDDGGGFVVEGPNGEVTVSVTAATTFTQQVEASSAALEAGRCARVEGDADDTGAITASAIQVSDAVDDQCGR